mmetsp:Transcript_24832/g.41491  ORF Transcript_24832/g.41491 Transcript_24832/m.41491 type:complete len:270 (+) Transcript_24832:1987-2796(+)
MPIHSMNNQYTVLLSLKETGKRFNKELIALIKSSCETESWNLRMKDFGFGIVQRRHNRMAIATCASEFVNWLEVNRKTSQIAEELIGLATMEVYYRKATIFGIDFRAGQLKDRESYPFRHIVNNVESRWPNNWFDNHDLSHWCLYWSSDTRQRAAQINGFIHVNLPSDPVLHGLIFVSVCSRKFTIGTDNLIRIIPDDSSYNPELFISSTRFVSSSINSAGFDDKSHPIMANSVEHGKMKSFVLIQRHPNRANVKFYPENISYYKVPFL